MAERGGVDLLPELGYRPTNKYLPPREPVDPGAGCGTAAPEPSAPAGGGADRLFRWLDRVLGA